MTKLPKAKLLVVAAVVALVIGGGYFAVKAFQRASRNEVVGYFQNTNQLFSGDDVMIQGVPVGKVEKIECRIGANPQPPLVPHRIRKTTEREPDGPVRLQPSVEHGPEIGLLGSCTSLRLRIHQRIGGDDPVAVDQVILANVHHSSAIFMPSQRAAALRQARLSQPPIFMLHPWHKRPRTSFVS